MKTYGMLLQRHTGLPVDVHSYDDLIAVEHNYHRWWSDGFEIAGNNHECVRDAFTPDCCDREPISWVTTTGGLGGESIRDLKMESVEARFGGVGPPQAIE